MSDTEADADYVAVCTDTGTNTRVDDDRCGNAPENYSGVGRDGGSFMWFYMPTAGGYTAPPVGQKVSVGQYTTPRGSVTGKTPVVARAGAVPTGGGAVVRGGFGAGAAKSGGSGS